MLINWNRIIATDFSGDGGKMTTHQKSIDLSVEMSTGNMCAVNMSKSIVKIYQQSISEREIFVRIIISSQWIIISTVVSFTSISLHLI